MSHYSEDQLLEYALEMLDDDERVGIEAHLRLCPECHAELESIKRDTDMIGSVKPYRQLMQMSNPRTRRAVILSVMKVAALLTLGFFVGFGAAGWIERKPAEAAYAYLTLTPPEDSNAGCSVSDATEISPGYYEEILLNQE